MKRDSSEIKSPDYEIEGCVDFSKSSDSDDLERSLLWTGHDTSHRDGRFRKHYSKKIPSLSVHIWVTTVNIALFIISGFMWTSLRGNQIALQDQWRATSYYSPIFDRFDIPKITQVTNGTLFDTNPPSIWRARIGDEADAAWDRVGSTVPPIAITADEVRAIGKNPDTAVKFPGEYGYGPDAYMASVEVFHHLHCLDKLRKEISYAHYWEKEEGPAPGRAMHEAHTSHCIDVLAQALRCTGSVDIITYNWVEGRSMMLPDFENNKVCRDFDAILDWTNKNGVPMDESRLRAMSPPPGALRVPNPLGISHEK